MVEDVYKIRVKDVMTQDPVTLNADDTIREALAIMGENRVSALPVLDRQDRCTGILSTSDMVDMTRDTEDELRQLSLLDPAAQRPRIDQLAESMGGEVVQSYMSESVSTVCAETLIGKAAQVMLRNRVHHLPVVDNDEHLVGIISTMDILCVFADAAPQ